MGVCFSSQEEKLFQIAEKGNVKNLKKFLDSKENTKIINRINTTPIFDAMLFNTKHGASIAMELVERNTDVNAKNKDGFSVLAVAIRTYNMELCLELLKRGANPEAKTDLGYNPLLMASRLGFSNMVAELLNRKADINCFLVENKATALHLALRFSQCCDEMIYPDNRYKNYALERDQPRTVDILLKNKADPNQKTIKGNTSLHMAMVRSDIIKLLEHGADVNIRNNNGLTAFDYMIHYNILSRSSDTLELLRPTGPPSYQVLFS
jgi:ankyrin repeat protein